eukprot:SAG31_NODE_5405_length_2556_cov_1.432234_4_plen_84_part_00
MSEYATTKMRLATVVEARVLEAAILWVLRCECIRKLLAACRFQLVGCRLAGDKRKEPSSADTLAHSDNATLPPTTKPAVMSHG